MAIQIGEKRSVSHEPVERFRTTPATRTGAPSGSLLPELILGSLPIMEFYIPDGRPVDNISLRKLVKKHGEKMWLKIANDLPGRIGKQCRERWFNHLRPDIKKTGWKIKEEHMLVSWHRKLGNKWAKMAKHIPGRPENTVKNHWNATLRRLKSKRPSKAIEMAIKDGTRSNVLELYMRELGLEDLKEAATPTSPVGADLPVLDAVPAGKQADDNPSVMEPSSGVDSIDHCWMQSLCGGMLPPLIMQESESETREDCVYVMYGNDGYGRYVHLQPTPGHGYAPVNQAAAAAAGYYNPVPVPYYPFTAQQVYTHNPEARGCDYSNSGAGGDEEAHDNAGFDPAASGQGSMSPSANAPQHQLPLTSAVVAPFGVRNQLLMRLATN